MKAKAFVGLWLVVAWMHTGAGIAAAQTGWMQPGVRLWYLGGVGSGPGDVSSNAEETCLFDAVTGTNARIVRHHALTHWTSPLLPDSGTYSLLDQGPCWMHPDRLQTVAPGDYWRDPEQEIEYVERKDYTYATFMTSILPAKVHLLPIRALFDLQPTRQIVKLVFYIDLFSTGSAYFDAQTGLLLHHLERWGSNSMFFVLAEINYDFAQQAAFAEDDGPHTGFKSFVSEQSLGSPPYGGVGGGSIIIQSLVETRYGNAVEARVLSSRTPTMYPDTGIGDENYCFFGDIPIVRRKDATQAGNYLPEQWDPFGQYLWWWLPPTATGAQAIAPVGQAATEADTDGTAVDAIDVFDVAMAKTSDAPLVYTASTTPSRFHFTKLWFGSDGYMTQFAAKDPTSGLNVQPGDFIFQNLTKVDGLDYYKSTLAPRPSMTHASGWGGTAVTIAGFGFVPGTGVTFGGVPSTQVTVVGTTQLTARAPAHAPGAVDVVVSGPFGSATFPAAFTYLNTASLGLAFDDDFATDVAVYRPSTGEWFILPSGSDFDRAHSQTVKFGAAGDQPVRGDFDGDGRRDEAVYRSSTGTWFWLKSSVNNTVAEYKGWGLQAQGDVPAPGDYDGDGKTDPTVYRPAFGTWFVLKSSTAYTQYAWYGWGAADDTLVPGDYDGDGVTDIAVYRPSNRHWYIRLSSTGFSTAQALDVQFGMAGDVPVDGDFDGDGKRDIAVYRPATGTWFWLKSSLNNAGYDYRGFGVEAHNDVPVPGDYDGDGKTDLCVYRAKYGTWFILWSSQGSTTYSAYGWGEAADVPLGGAR